MSGEVKGIVYLLHKFIVTKGLYEFVDDEMETKGRFLLCGGNLNSKTDNLYVRTEKSRWTRWPVNLEECKIYLSVWDEEITYFEKPDIFIDEKGRYCFDALKFLEERNLGYVTQNMYSSAARLSCSNDSGYVCSGGMWKYRGRKNAGGKISMYNSTGYFKLEHEKVNKMIISVEYNPFIGHPEFKEYITDFLANKQDLTNEELCCFLDKLPVESVEIKMEEKIKNIMFRDDEIDISEQDNNLAESRNLDYRDCYDLSDLISLEMENGTLLYLKGRQYHCIPGRLVFREGKKELEVQWMVDPKVDCLVYRNRETGVTIMKKVEEFSQSDNLMRIPIVDWLEENNVEYFVRPKAKNKDVYGQNCYLAMLILDTRDNWEAYLKRKRSFSFERSFDKFDFIYLSLKEPKYDSMKVIYVGRSFEEVKERMLGEVEIDEDIDEKLTKKLLAEGKEFHYDGRFSEGQGYVRWLNSYRELLYFGKKMGFENAIKKEYSESPMNYLLREGMYDFS